MKRSLRPSRAHCPKRYGKLLKVLRYGMVGFWVLLAFYLIVTWSLKTVLEPEALIQKEDTQNVATGLSYHLHHKDQTLTAQSPKATYRSDKTIDLEGPVTLTTSDGTHLVTERVHLDPEKKSLKGDKPLQGEGPKGTLRADAFKVEASGDELTLQGNAELTFYEN